VNRELAYSGSSGKGARKSIFNFQRAKAGSEMVLPFCTFHAVMVGSWIEGNQGLVGEVVSQKSVAVGAGMSFV